MSGPELVRGSGRERKRIGRNCRDAMHRVVTQTAILYLERSETRGSSTLPSRDVCGVPAPGDRLGQTCRRVWIERVPTTVLLTHDEGSNFGRIRKKVPYRYSIRIRRIRNYAMWPLASQDPGPRPISSLTITSHALMRHSTSRRHITMLRRASRVDARLGRVVPRRRVEAQARGFPILGRHRRLHLLPPLYPPTRRVHPVASAARVELFGVDGA